MTESQKNGEWRKVGGIVVNLLVTLYLLVD